MRRASIFYAMQGEEKERLPDMTVAFNRLRPTAYGVLSAQGGAFGTWTRKYCVLANNSFYVFRQAKAAEAELPEAAVSLDVSGVTDASKHCNKKQCFSLVKPQRIYFFQASSEKEFNDWTTALHNAIDELAKREPCDYTVPVPLPPGEKIAKKTSGKSAKEKTPTSVSATKADPLPSTPTPTATTGITRSGSQALPALPKLPSTSTRKVTT